MPDLRPGLHNIADRANHLHDGTFFRKDGTVINAPDDLAEGAGDFVTLNRDGNPLSPDGQTFFEFLSPENPDGWFPYLGASPSGVSGPTKQAASPLPIGRPSFLGNQPIFQGDPPPSQNDPAAAKLPRPETPLLVAEEVGIEGFAESTVSSPFFLKLSYGKGRAGSVAHSGLSPAVVVPPIENGQSIRAILYEDVPEGVTHIGVWLTAPGTSTASTPGPFYLQRDVEVENYNPGTYDLTGPWRGDTREPVANETRLPQPRAASLRLVRRSGALKPGQYFALYTWADKNGESLPGQRSSMLGIDPDPYYDEFDEEGNLTPSTVGRGVLYVDPPTNPPPGATGWRAYVYTDDQYYVLYDSVAQEGNDRPFPLGHREIPFRGWSSAGDNQYAALQTVYLVSREPPTENTSGIEDPEDDLEQPVVFGVVRPPAGTYYGQITETARGKESIPSRVASVTITGNQIPRLIRVDAVDPIPNSQNLEVGADGLPLDHEIVSPVGGAFMEGTDLVLQTVPGDETEDYSSATRWIAIDPKEDWYVDTLAFVENSLQGAVEGSLEMVLEETDVNGSITQTVLSTLSAVGGENHTQVIFSTGTTIGAGEVKWQSDTVSARLLTRFAGTKMKARIRHRHLHSGKHRPHRRRRRRHVPWPPYRLPTDPLDPPDPPEPPWIGPGTEVDADVPIEDPPIYEPLPAASPALVEWPTPARPSSSGVPYESTHDFEVGFPTGWEQNISGATLTRASGSVLTGTYSLRSNKSTP